MAIRGRWTVHQPGEGFPSLVGESPDRGSSVHAEVVRGGQWRGTAETSLVVLPQQLQHVVALTQIGQHEPVLEDRAGSVAVTESDRGLALVQPHPPEPPLLRTQVVHNLERLRGPA